MFKIRDMFREIVRVIINPKFSLGIVVGYLLSYYVVEHLSFMPIIFQIFKTVMLMFLVITIAIMYFKEMGNDI